MTRSVARVCAGVFVVLLFLPATLGLLGVHGAAIENRSLAEFPSIRPASVIDQGFYTALSQFLLDHLPLRDVLIRANGVMAVNVWKDSPNPEVHIGRGEWLYTTPFRSSCPDQMPLSVIERLTTLGRAFERSQRQMRLVLPPNKAAVYPENLGVLPPSHYACGIAQLDALRRGLSQVREIGFIDMWSHLMGVKANGGDLLYFPRDSHWTMRGAAEMSHAVVDSIEPGLWRDADVKVQQQIQLPMDLALMIGVPGSVPVTLTETLRDGVSTQVVERIDCELGPSCIVRYASRGDGRRLIRQRTLIVRDSFGTMSMATLAPYFEDVTFLYWSKDLQEQLTRRMADADIVVYETLDQFLFGRVNAGFTDMAVPPRTP